MLLPSRIFSPPTLRRLTTTALRMSSEKPNPIPPHIVPQNPIQPSNPPTPKRVLSPSPAARKMSTSPTTSADAVPPPSIELDQIETAKRKAAFRAVQDHFSSDMRFVGIGSGSTIVYGVEAIKHHLSIHPPKKEGHMNWFIPTGWNSRKVIEQAGLIPIAFDSLPATAMLDVCFDGADEVDSELNCIKGGGACLFQEKLVACRSKRFICIADYRKNQARLLTKWPSIPIEVAPIAHASVLRALALIGARDPKLREHSLVKTGPIQTDQSFYIIDAPFQTLLSDADVAAGKDGSGKDGVWGVNELAKRIKEINGVLEVGLFHGMNGDEAQAAGLQGGQKPVAVYFGMEDGEVSVLKAPTV